MTKPLVSALVLVATLCAPALAAPPPLKPGPVRLKFTVRVGTATRTHELMLAENECGDVLERTAEFSDEIHSCLSITPTREITLKVEWSTREASNEYKTKTGALVMPGKPFELDGGGAHLSITAS